MVVVSNGISRLKRSAFNAVALDTKELQNSNRSLREALANAPGMKVRAQAAAPKKEDEQPADSLNKKAASENKEKDKNLSK